MTTKVYKYNLLIDGECVSNGSFNSDDSNTEDTLIIEGRSKIIKTEKERIRKGMSMQYIDIDNRYQEASRLVAQIERERELLNIETLRQAKKIAHDKVIKVDIIDEYVTSKFDERFEELTGVPVRENLFIERDNGISLEWVRDVYEKTGKYSPPLNLLYDGTLEVTIDYIIITISKVNIGVKDIYLLKGSLIKLNSNGKDKPLVATINYTGNTFFCVLMSDKSYHFYKHSNYMLKSKNLELSEIKIISDNIDNDAFMRELKLQKVKQQLLT